ncbi:MAG: hypothetical protein IH898_12755 [Planctomycetes bacterium]|nr:hypothetical protein [Planctomycetota bacterium]
MIYRDDAGAKSATNPEYTGNGMLSASPIVEGTIGEVSTVSVTIEGSDGVKLARGV